jgi:FkbM family methyltransferase
MESIYEYLKNELFLKKNYVPARVLDIGAWNGFWTKSCKTFWPTSHYTCIEAGENHRKDLEAITEDVHIAVVGDTNKTVSMHLIETRPGKIKYTKGSSLFSWNSKEHTRSAEMVTLKTLVGDDARFNFIKQDVQGAELMIMQGSPKIFQRADYVLNEVNTDKIGTMPSYSEMNDYMNTLGFNLHTIIGDHGKENQVDVLYWKS